MPRKLTTPRVDLAHVFQRVQEEMMAHLSVGRLFDHPTAAGAASELRWKHLFRRYLPRRYGVSSAFVVDSDGRCSRQIDLAVYDRLYSPPLFPHPSGPYVAVESVYAVFEVKTTMTPQAILDAGEKAASVRALRRTSVPVIAAGARRPAIRPKPILAGILATDSTFRKSTFEAQLRRFLIRTPRQGRLDLGCCLEGGAFEKMGSQVRVSDREESLIFFVLRLIDRLRLGGTAPAANLMRYGQSLASFRR